MIVKEPDLTGETLNNYKIVGKLGRGGMASVYKAHELSLNRMVALKVLSTQLSEDEEYIKRFQREAQAAAQLNHPNIVQIYSIGEEKGLHYFAMELIKGESLLDLKKKEGILDVATATTLIKQTADALADAHRIGLVHRDIKPSNIMIDQLGRAKVTDFGIAYVSTAQTKLTREGSVIGTPEYLSPEQCEGKTVDQRSDIYSLGVTFYELLTGKTPYEADTPVSMLMKIVRGEFPPLCEVKPDLPAELCRIVEKMMAKDLDARYASMTDVLNDLNRFKMPEGTAGTGSGTAAEDALRSGTEVVDVVESRELQAAAAGDAPRNNKKAGIIIMVIILLLIGGAITAKLILDQKKKETTVAGTDSSTVDTTTQPDADSSPKPFADLTKDTETVDAGDPGTTEESSSGETAEQESSGTTGDSTAGADATGANVTGTNATAVETKVETKAAQIAGTETGSDGTQEQEGPESTEFKSQPISVSTEKTGSGAQGSVTGVERKSAALSSDSAKEKRTGVGSVVTRGSATGTGHSSGSQVVQPGPRPQPMTQPLPPARSCFVTSLGDSDKAEVVSAYIEELLGDKNYTVVDGPSVGNRKIEEVARHHVVVTVRQLASTTLNYYGQSTEQFSVSISVKVVSPQRGLILSGPISRTVQYTGLNAEENLREAARKLVSALKF